MGMQERLIESLYEKFKGETQASIAQRCGLKPPRFNNYAQGIRRMDVDAVIGCAQALGWDIRETVAAYLSETADSRREKSFWKEVGTLTAIGLLAVAAWKSGGWTFDWLFNQSYVMAIPLAASTLDPLYIMRNWLFLAAAAFLMHHLLSQRRSDP